jgi:hypothetical protein
MKKILVLALVSLFVLGMSTVVSAKIGYGPVVIDDATVVAKGTGEVRGEITYAKVEDTDAATLTLEGILDYGVMDKLEVGVSIPYLSLSNGSDESGIGDITVGAKYALLTEDAATCGLSLGAGLVLATGDEDIVGADNEMDILVELACSKAVGAVNLHGNLGLVMPGEDDADSIVAYGAAVEYPLNSLCITGELLGSNQEIGDDSPMALYAGIKYNASDALDVIGNVGIGLTDASADLILGGGVIYAF